MIHRLRILEKFFSCGKICKKCKNGQKILVLQKHLHSGTTYTQKWHIHHVTVWVDSPCATSDNAEHWGPCDDSHLTCVIVRQHQVREMRTFAMDDIIIIPLKNLLFYTTENILKSCVHLWSTVLMLLKMVIEYCQLASDIPTASPEILNRLIELLKVWCIAFSVCKNCLPFYTLTLLLQVYCRRQCP